MPRWGKLVVWVALVWTAAIAATAAVVTLTGGCGGVAPSDFHVCELGRDSTISGLAMLWFIGAAPAMAAVLLARGRRPRCRICGDELGGSERRLCRDCGVRLIRTAARPE